jgi:DNA-binding winged helix-turn-helix (wHTH) protein
MNRITEAQYPISFRADEARELGQRIRNHHSVSLIGMKRVGISNFLRFFLHHPDITKTYIQAKTKELFIPIDLNDLISCELFPFWRLTLKRLVDTVEDSQLSDELKERCRRYFSQSIQLNDLFFTFDSVQKVISLLVEENIVPVLFFMRFDRMKNATTSDFFHNLEALSDRANQQLTFVFTSYRPLSEILAHFPSNFSSTILLEDMYLRPASLPDMQIILQTLQQRYDLKLRKSTQEHLIAFSGGHVQYLQFSLIYLSKMDVIPDDQQELFQILVEDEEITLQSEELFASLTPSEQDVLLQTVKKKNILNSLEELPSYLVDTGILKITKEKGIKIFSPFLEHFLQQKSSVNKAETEFTKKEFLLFDFLKQNENRLCEREDVVEAIWPECKETGVSDWAIDRLVSRVRQKLKKQQSSYKIVTVVTRGYKLVNTQLPVR